MPEAAESPAIRKLGRLFRTTEVHLWEYSYVAVANESHKHRSSTETGFASSRAARVDSKPAKETDDGSVFVEDLELANLMGSLGLPVSFSTSREKKKSVNKGKKNGKQAPYESGNTPIDDAVKTEVNAEPIDSVVQPIVCDEQTGLHDMSWTKVGYDEDSHDGVDKILAEASIYVEDEGSGHGAICNAEITPGEAAKNNCENEASAAEENHVDDNVMQLNKETMGHNFVDDEYKCSCTEICQGGSLSKREDQIFLETSSMSHDSELVDCEPCQSSVEPYLCDKHVQKSDCSLYCEHGDWMVVWDTFYNRYYFYNNQTQESTWYPPSGLEDFVLYCSTYTSEELDGQGSQDTSCPMQEHIKSPAKFDQSLDVISSHEDNTTDCYTSEANQHVVQYVAQHISICDEGKETFDEATIIEQFNRQGHDPCDKLCNSSDIPFEDLTNESLVTTSDEGKHAENVQATSLTADVLDMDLEVASTKKKKRVRRSQSHHSCQDMAGNISNDIIKYWTQRYSLFSLFDSGIKMDEEGWFSVTPEAIAKHHASRVSTGTVIDCFTGVGGNAIQFAYKCKHVIAVDIDPQKIDCAQHNATVYGVNDHIDFLVGDFIQITPRLKGETAFMSPPWGGPDYAKVDIYDIRTMLKPRDGYSLFKLATMIASRVVMFLPRNIDLNQLAEISLSVDPPWAVEVEKNFLNGKLKAITAYFEEQETNPKI